ncbi:hypothetical protein FISHEDRAFT_76740 [Fistulina hepatica ATCC 64428]|uniref:Aminoglycoside phosphotransferase domain-containing protein n=1 Tax=Fistulina hepatica ATCC 64428 TaxID=1128425 RepID=A0A0D7A345_9AGAR|nr:hypothetical protein FISHEDRAFT_76740 [Fistulina hepatica ATCC 64428]
MIAAYLRRDCGGPMVCLKPPENVEDLANYGDEDLLACILASPCFTGYMPNGFQFNTRAHLLSDTLVAKHAPERRDKHPADEMSAMRLAHALGVRTPELHRVIADGEGHGQYLIMSRIHGVTLEVAWPTLGWWSTLQLAWQLRRFVAAMRAVTSCSAGGLVSGVARCRFFANDKAGPAPHASPEALTEYMNWWLLRCRAPSISPRVDLELRTRPVHVFTHTDLHAQNMLVDNDGHLWLIDWDFSGYYPIYVEYAGMRMYRSFGNSCTGRFARWRWNLFQWLSTGFYIKEAKAMSVILNRTTRFAYDRRSTFMVNQKSNAF